MRDDDTKTTESESHYERARQWVSDYLTPRVSLTMYLSDHEKAYFIERVADLICRVTREERSICVQIAEDYHSPQIARAIRQREDWER